MADFSSTGISYLVRRTSSGVYYWQAKIGGSSKRGSLRTKSKSVAKSKLPIALSKARADYEGAISIKDADDPILVKEWLDHWVSKQQSRPGLKSRTKDDCEKLAKILKKESWSEIEIGKLKAKALECWWSDTCDGLKPATANARLRVLKAAIKLAIKCRAISIDPSEDLQRMPMIQRVIEVPTVEQVLTIVDSVRSQNKRASDESANMIEFAAYSGLRPGELKELKCSDISDDFLIVRGGEEGTKNRSEREVPIIDPLRKLIDRMEIRDRVGKIFSIKSPYRALVSACSRLKIKRMTVYELRHMFATVCIEEGVDVPTVASWMGHKDGGALLMKTYTHVRRRHSLEQAARVRFK